MHDRCNCHNCNCGSGSGEGKLLAGLILGGIIGAGVAVYLSTDQGKAKLKDLRAKMDEYKEELEDKVDQLKAEKLDPLMKEAKAEFQNTVKRWKSVAPEAKTKKV